MTYLGTFGGIEDRPACRHHPCQHATGHGRTQTRATQCIFGLNRGLYCRQNVASARADPSRPAPLAGPPTYFSHSPGAITVRHDERQIYATNGGKEAIDAWIAIRGDWPGALLCPVAKGGCIQPRDMAAQAVMVRVRTIAEQAGVGLVTPNDLRLTYLTALERQRLDARTKGRPEGLSAPMMLSVPYQAP